MQMFYRRTDALYKLSERKYVDFGITLAKISYADVLGWATAPHNAITLLPCYLLTQTAIQIPGQGQRHKIASSPAFH
jgi:hypothetical protein